MGEAVSVEIVGTPVACAEGFKESWRDVAHLVQRQLGHRFGDLVTVRYYDLFDPACTPIPPGAQLPLVLVNGELFTSGGKISVALIRGRLEQFGLQPTPSHG